MSESAQKEAGTIQAMLQQLNDVRLPRALELKKKVDRGEKLDDYDLQFLEGVLEDVLPRRSLRASRAGWGRPADGSLEEVRTDPWEVELWEGAFRMPARSLQDSQE